MEGYRRTTMYDLLNMPQIMPEAPSKRYIEKIADKAKFLKFYTKEDQELKITCRTDDGLMRVLCLEATDDQMVIVQGYDEEGHQTFYCAPSSSLAVTMKIVQSKPDAPRDKIGFKIEGKDIGV
jgi:hypothetical protein